MYLVCLPQGRRETFPRLNGECQRPAVPARGVADQDHAIAARGLYAVAAVGVLVRAFTPAHISVILSIFASDTLALSLSL